MCEQPHLLLSVKDEVSFEDNHIKLTTFRLLWPFSHECTHGSTYWVRSIGSRHGQVFFPGRCIQNLPGLVDFQRWTLEYHSARLADNRIFFPPNLSSFRLNLVNILLRESKPLWDSIQIERRETQASCCRKKPLRLTWSPVWCLCGWNTKTNTIELVVKVRHGEIRKEQKTNSVPKRTVDERRRGLQRRAIQNTVRSDVPRYGVNIRKTQAGERPGKPGIVSYICYPSPQSTWGSLSVTMLADAAHSNIAAQEEAKNTSVDVHKMRDLSSLRLQTIYSHGQTLWTGRKHRLVWCTSDNLFSFQEMCQV